jgi:hypothetical protein
VFEVPERHQCSKPLVLWKCRLQRAKRLVFLASVHESGLARILSNDHLDYDLLAALPTAQSMDAGILAHRNPRRWRPTIGGVASRAMHPTVDYLDNVLFFHGQSCSNR